MKRIGDVLWNAFVLVAYAFICLFIDPDDRPLSTLDPPTDLYGAPIRADSDDG